MTGVLSHTWGGRNVKKCTNKDVNEQGLLIPPPSLLPLDHISFAHSCFSKIIHFFN
jgi:hypothetical protein